MNPQKPTVSFSAPVCTCIIINFFFLSRLQICSYLFCELLKIAFYLHCSVGGPLHHYLLPADDRMIGFLLGFSLVFLTKSWIYSSNYYYFFSESSDFSALIWFRDLRWDSSHLLLEEYASAHRLRHLFLVFFFFVCVQVSPGKVFDLAR